MTMIRLDDETFVNSSAVTAVRLGTGDDSQRRVFVYGQGGFVWMSDAEPAAEANATLDDILRRLNDW